MLLDKRWDLEDEYSCYINYKDVTDGSLRSLLRDFIGQGQLERTKTRKQLLAAAKKCKLHDKRIRGSDALRYRAGTVISMLSRLDRHVPDASTVLGKATLVRRGEWTLVSNVSPECKVREGSVVSAVAGANTLIESYDDTRKRLLEVGRGPCAFRAAPFHAGFVELTGARPARECQCAVSFVA